VCKVLRQYSVEELLHISDELYMGVSRKSKLMRKILDHIQAERRQNEFSRTEVKDRKEDFNITLQQLQFDLNR
jgi:hypothetical protein